MSRLRFFVLLALVMSFVISLSTAQAGLTVTPPAGPHGTTHVVEAVGLAPNTQYTLEVLYQPTGAVVFSTPAVADSNGAYQIALTTEQSDPPGLYTVQLRDGAGAVVSSGTITLEVATAGAGLPALSVGVTDGQLDSNIASHDYQFEGTAGQIISLTLTSTDFDAFLVLYGTDGAQLRYSDNGLPPTDAQIVALELPATGTYRVSATSRNAAESNGGQRVTGAYRLTFAVARSANEGAIANGELIVGELSVVQQSAQYEFNGVAGDVVTIDLRSEAFDPAVGLFSANGDRLITDDDGGGGLNARINRFRLPSDGLYFIIVDGFRGLTGERTLQGKYTVSLSVETAGGGAPVVQATPTAPAPLTQATAVPVPSSGAGLDYGQTVVGELTTDVQVGRYTFFGTAGDVITIQLDSDNFDPKFRLLDADGVVIAEDDDSGEGLNALVADFTLPRDGEYVLEVDGFRGPAGDRQLLGAFSLSVNRTSQAAQAAPTSVPTTAPDATSVPATPVPPVTATGSIASGVPVTGELTETTQSVFYTFEGAIGDVVTLTVESTEFDPLARLLDPDGDILAEDDDGGGNFNARISDIILTEAGTYTLQVDSFRGVNPSTLVLGRYTATLTLVPAPVIPTAVPTLEPTTVPTLEPTPAPTVEPTAESEQPTVEPTPTSSLPTSTPVIAPTDSLPGATPVPGKLPPVNLMDVRLIAYGDSASVVFDGIAGAAETFGFIGSAGDLVSVKVTSAGDVDTALRLLMADGTLVAEDDDSGAGFDPELSGVTLPSDGNYVLVLYTLSSAAQSSVTLELSAVKVGTLETGTVTVTLSDKLAPQSLTFEATAGEVIRLSVTSVSQVGGDPVIQVQQNGQVLASNSVGQNLRMSFEFIVPADGRVDVKIIRDLGAYGVIEVGIERVP